jgi:hypothetical protein
MREGLSATRPLRTCGSRLLVRTRAANKLDFAVTPSRSRISTWMFFELVSCAFANAGHESSLRGRIAFRNLLFATNHWMVASRTKAACMLRKCGLFASRAKAAATAQFRSQSPGPLECAGSVSGKSQVFLTLEHSFCPFCPDFGHCQTPCVRTSSWPQARLLAGQAAAIAGGGTATSAVGGLLGSLLGAGGGVGGVGASSSIGQAAAELAHPSQHGKALGGAAGAGGLVVDGQAKPPPHPSRQHQGQGQLAAGLGGGGGWGGSLTEFGTALGGGFLSTLGVTTVSAGLSVDGRGGGGQQ